MQLMLPILTSSVYLAAAYLFLRVYRSQTNIIIALGALVLACQLHALLLVGQVNEGVIINLSIFNVISIFAWGVGCLSLIWLWRSSASLAGIIVCLMNAVFTYLPTIFPGEKPFMSNLSPGMLWHILSSIAAWIALSIAVINALLYGWLFQRLKKKRLIQSGVMSLVGLERSMMWLTIIGTTLLSFSLFSGWLFVDNLFAQHLWHKTMLTILSWLTYCWLCLIYFLHHARGIKIVYLNLAGYTLLVTGYVISNVIIQFILH